MVRARGKLEELHDLLDQEGIAGENGPKLRKALDEFDTYLVLNQPLIPNYGERWRNEETIATGFVEADAPLRRTATRGRGDAPRIIGRHRAS